MKRPGFYYEKNQLTADGLPLKDIAETFETPIYVYSGELLRANYRRLDQSFEGIDRMIAYSVKANSNLAVLQLLAEEGAGFDIVSGGELERVKQVGIPGDRIIFAGVGKTAAEMKAAIDYGVAEFNVESVAEAERLHDVAKELGKKAPIAIRINPDVDAKTHKKINTGPKASKFGVPTEQAFDLAKRIGKDLDHLDLVGLHCHIGSQILDPTRHAMAVSVVHEFAKEISKAAGINLKTLNFGGGFGIAYDKKDSAMDMGPFADALKPALKDLGVKLILEPGRSICAPTGVLLTKVEYIKPGEGKTFVIIDGSMTELMRPTLYEAHHDILPVEEKDRMEGVTDVVGPVCETGDFLALGRTMGIPEAGELLAVMDAGAYGFVMASNYNTRGKPAEILVVDGEAHLARKRETIEDCFRSEMLRAKS